MSARRAGVAWACAAVVLGTAVPAAAHVEFLAPETVLPAATPVSLTLYAEFEQRFPINGRDDTTTSMTAVVPQGWTDPTCGPARTAVGTDLAPGAVVPGWSCQVQLRAGRAVLVWSGPQVPQGQTFLDSARLFTFTVTPPAVEVPTTYDGTSGTEGFVSTQAHASGEAFHWIPSAGFAGEVPDGAATIVSERLVRVVVPAEACGNGATPDAAYVQFLYTQALERCAEPAAEAHWVDALGAGIRRGDLARALVLSSESLATQVIRPAYLQAYGREPRPAELAHWQREIAREGTAVRLLGLLAASDVTYFGRTTAAPCGAAPIAYTPQRRAQVWVEHVYCALLDRLPTAGAREAWVRRMLVPAGDASFSTVSSRYAVYRGIADSLERARRVVETSFPRDLGRPAGAQARPFTAYLLDVLEGRELALRGLLLGTAEAYALAQAR